jgi:nucleotide-binding universal stress UspA family protein
MVSRGNPAKVIAEVAEREGAELIIMTSHTTRGLEHMIPGSVADKVLRSTPCPVLVIPIRDGHGASPEGGATGYE